MTQKEAVFQSALALYLEQDAFRTSLSVRYRAVVSSGQFPGTCPGGVQSSGTITGTRQFENGINLSSALAVDLATLLASGTNSSLGLRRMPASLFPCSEDQADTL